MEYEIHRNDELTHWGIKGMRWGIRRYQNKDGSLTPAGKKHLAKREAALKDREKIIKNKERTRAKFTKLESKKKELDERDEALGEGKKQKGLGKKKNATPQDPVKKMSDEELRNATNRMQLETNYYNAKKNLATANPPKISRGKKFMDELTKDVIVPAVKNAGKNYLENVLKNLTSSDKKKSESDVSLDDLLEPYRGLSTELKEEIKNASVTKSQIDKLRGKKD